MIEQPVEGTSISDFAMQVMQKVQLKQTHKEKPAEKLKIKPKPAKPVNHKVPKKHNRELSITDVLPVPAISDLRIKAMGLDAYMSVAKIQPAGLVVVSEEPRMTLIDLFEYLSICWEHDKKTNADVRLSAAWTLFKYLGVADILTLRATCRSSAKLANHDMQRRAIAFGLLEGTTRTSFWVLQVPMFEIQQELKRQLNIGSVFTPVLEEVLQRIKKQPLDKKLVSQIQVDV